MKRLLLCLLLCGCETTETFDASGKVTSRTRKPSPQTWTAIDGAVKVFGQAAVEGWLNQMADQQRWEKGQK